MRFLIRAPRQKNQHEVISRYDINRSETILIDESLHRGINHTRSLISTEVSHRKYLERLLSDN